MNTIQQIVQPHTPTPTVPDIPALVEVPHSMTASAGKRWSAKAINLHASRAAMHALTVAAICAGSCKTVQIALRYSYVAIDREMREAYSHANYHGGILYAWHGTKAFSVQE